MFSTEVCQHVPYSTDLRWQIIWRPIGLEQNFRDIARSLNVLSCLRRREMLTLSTMKQIQHIAIQRSARHRGAYIEEMTVYKSSMLVFADETGRMDGIV